MIVPLYELTDRSLEVASFSAICVVKTSAVEPDPLTYDAVSLLDSVSVGVPVTTTASPQVTVIESVSPTPYAASVAATLTKSGASPSTVTAPRSPPVIVVDTALAFPSFIVAPPAVGAIELTDRSAESVSPSATVVVNTISVLPDPLA